MTNFTAQVHDCVHAVRNARLTTRPSSFILDDDHDNQHTASMSEKAELVGFNDGPSRQPRRNGKITTAFLLTCTALFSLAWTTPFDISPLSRLVNPWSTRQSAAGTAFWTKCNREGYHERTLCGSLKYVFMSNVNEYRLPGHAQLISSIVHLWTILTKMQAWLE